MGHPAYDDRHFRLACRVVALHRAVALHHAVALRRVVVLRHVVVVVRPAHC